MSFGKMDWTWIDSFTEGLEGFLDRLDMDDRDVKTTKGCHVEKTEDTVVLHVEVPGCSQDDVDITLEGDVLKIVAKSNYPRKDSKIVRTFQVSSELDRNNIEAQMSNGLLTVVLHSTPKPASMKIKING